MITIISVSATVAFLISVALEATWVPVILLAIAVGVRFLA